MAHRTPRRVNPLDLPIESVALEALSFNREMPSGLFTGQGFFHWLNAAKGTTLWVMTYTASSLCPLEVEVTRLLTEIGGYPRAKQSKRLLRIHTKLYLQWMADKVVGCYIGSQNLVAPTTDNLMVQLKPDYYDLMLAYYEHFWKQGR